MNALPLLFCLCFSSAAPEPRDRWFGEDKLKHFFASFAATSFAASAARTTGLDPASSAWVGAGAGTGLGVWKELRDRGTRNATFSVRDLTWDLAGVATATALMRQVR